MFGFNNTSDLLKQTYMKFTAVFVSLCFCVIISGAQTSTGLLKKMYDRHHDKWHSTLKFDQATERYSNDSLISTATWYETIVYPDLLRIDIGKSHSDNGILFRHDSTYIFRNNKIVKSVASENELIFFLGGLYFMPFDSVTTHFKELNYDLSKYHPSTWKGKPVYVMGATADGERLNQLWIDAEKLVPIRFIKYDNNTKEGLV
jgi:hypothetical protein